MYGNLWPTLWRDKWALVPMLFLAGIKSFWTFQVKAPKANVYEWRLCKNSQRTSYMHLFFHSDLVSHCKIVTHNKKCQVDISTYIYIKRFFLLSYVVQVFAQSYLTADEFMCQIIILLLQTHVGLLQPSILTLEGERERFRERQRTGKREQEEEMFKNSIKIRKKYK